jgi:tetratricopeptide (TPR) repeat protein
MSSKGDMGRGIGIRRGTVKAASLVMALALSTAGCAKIGSVMAMFKFKQANQAYVSQDYERAAALYEETVKNDPNNAIVYFYLGNSYDNLYKPGEKGKPENDAMMSKAVQNYQTAVEKLDANDPVQGKIKSLALQYLMAAYGQDKLDDPVKAEPVIIRLIQLEPGEPAYYYQLAKLYEDAGESEAAEKVYVAAKDAKPTDVNTYIQLAGYYNRQGNFPKAIDAFEQRAQKDPNNPEGFYTVATQYWDQAYRGVGVREADKKDYVQKGLVAIDHAIQLKPDYVEALVYKNLLLRRTPPSSRRSSSRPMPCATRPRRSARSRPPASATRPTRRWFGLLRPPGSPRRPFVFVLKSSDDQENRHAR